MITTVAATGKRFPLAAHCFPNTVKYANDIIFRVLPSLHKVNSGLPTARTYRRQPHYHDLISATVPLVPLASYCLGAYSTNYRTNDLSYSHTYVYPRLPMAWEHVDTAQLIIIPMASTAVTPVPSASYGLGTRGYCSTYYHSNGLDRSHTYTLGFLQPGNMWILLHNCSIDLSRSHTHVYL